MNSTRRNKTKKIIAQIKSLIDEIEKNELGESPEPIKCREWILRKDDDQDFEIYCNPDGVIRGDRTPDMTMRVIEPLSGFTVMTAINLKQADCQISLSFVEILEVLDELGMIAKNND